VNRLATERKTPKEQQVPNLQLYYKKAVYQPHADDDTGDDLENFGKFWDMQDQELVEFWSLKMIAMTRDCCLTTKNKNSDAYLPLSFHEKVKDINAGDGSKILLH
jgi:hypothetical protein